MVAFEENEIIEAWEEIFRKKEYRYLIQEIADSYPDKRSVFVNYVDMDLYNTDFAMYVLEEPDICIPFGIRVIQGLMPANWDTKNRINLRIQGLPRDSKVDIRKLRETHLGKLVAIEGLAKKVSSVKPRMTYARFTCSRCGAEVWEPQSGMYMREPLMCPNPNGTCNKQINRFILDNKRCRFIDTQKIEIQESPEGLRGGAQPERISGFVEDDISGMLTPGNRITLNGIVRPVEKQERDKSTLFDIYLDVLSVEFEQHEYDEIVITAEDEEKILFESKQPHLYENIVASIAPTIYGMTEVKRAIALQLFGGSHIVLDDGTSIRGDTHILLMGDPGVAKSQILRYMSGLAPRGIFASGKSASAAGLTAAAVKDDFGGEGFTLEAGALVLADKGLACIDELDKMTDQDRSSLHEAMESQKISVAKAGITATLQCRCSMLAAANPKAGRFNLEGESIADQINLPPALMSRFDLIFVLTDEPNENQDRNITRFILNVHRRGQVLNIHEDDEAATKIDVQKIRDTTENIKPYYSQEFLRKYVAYSKRFVPILTEKATKLIEDSYMTIRMSGGDSHSIPITARQLEAYIRLSEASAKMRLSPYVEEEDAKRAIQLVEYYLKKIAGGEGGMDVDRFMSSSSNSQRKKQAVLKGFIESQGKDGAALQMILDEMVSNEGFTEGETRELLRKMEGQGILYSPSPDMYKVV
ncbi:MAG: minichromosome maintenance protein MCM [archaeon]|nr:minichromosome maintenance protein MCM [archaeon]